ncbi:hypothetical protein A2767_01855 [Candidatus Roizmanbacteria bacterium RIFCSPHIGHO2_01_FULL_35_10]|uniref:DUF86 domain-containing protein n=1 Tax=Candidatus Roizmanbacteria bacterium RIFCSPLOWO2_01_FULL_35_13 TaxID=1802055 RepID=A0A1F7I7C7_9BACT|nr:MAG: hypothetical protein A2767_01855 [Candidatus Roizmanbacteria bacterium RIFCSPHIGHO2_01_FULL_35_10]OGK39277.1 MAG: hypothetical protein A3A74_00390 [Candidatus Roizmanbacteria bacterium RIFCSPLOWO2_01_FULL_35_13]
MKKDILVYIDDIIESIDKIEEYANRITEEDFERLESIQDAVLMRLAVIGESANKIPINIRKEHPEIPWRKIINLRNIIVHDYSSININRIWKIIKKDILLLKAQVEKLSSNISS